MKRIDTFILKNFLQIFVGAFFVCLFVFMLQFTYRYVDELVGKGLSLEILAKFFWYMAISLVPTSLPLGVLLASLITFGNMGEKLELLSMRAAGIPLIRIMRPVLLVVLLLTGISFYFQNFTAPKATMDLRTLLISMKQTQPAVEIPEGVFYSGVPNVNLFVEKKNAETGMLYQVIIYKTDQGFDRAQIVLADSARMAMTSDKMHLLLTMWNGEQFENLQSTGFSALSVAGVPYDRETFQYKQFIIDFDANFNLMDKEMLAGLAQAKNMKQIAHDADSVTLYLDSLGTAYYHESRREYFYPLMLSKADSLRLCRQYAKTGTAYDSLWVSAMPGDKQVALQSAATTVQNMERQLSWRGEYIGDSEMYVRRHWVEWHQKMTLALSCLFFFFIGAPLGGIIRKGGLGMPTVISVAIFILYYIINVSTMKMAREGAINMAFGMWFSSMVLAPCGALLTYQANRDAVAFNFDQFVLRLRRLLGFRSQRNIQRKDIILTTPDYAADYAALQTIVADIAAYEQAHHLLRAPSYVQTFFRSVPDDAVSGLEKRVEAVIEDLSNTTDVYLLGSLSEMPILYTHAHQSPLRTAAANKAAGIFLPVGLALWLRMWRFRLRLHRDLATLTEACQHALLCMERNAQIKATLSETLNPLYTSVERHEEVSDH